MMIEKSTKISRRNDPSDTKSNGDCFVPDALVIPAVPAVLVALTIDR